MGVWHRILCKIFSQNKSAGVIPRDRVQKMNKKRCLQDISFEEMRAELDKRKVKQNKGQQDEGNL
ncbi:MAG TPA: hypothetical protein IAB06_06455 [Candidatus Avacidaminococcus intestinavium]|uniref:Uncharacterized protein n=1 Tax=Candidatus Avacidaminococcus intestinavium TaxID=2840684 RepID=A0A9D1SLU0_9FIRM|nr:hypothetical protein [Candidatus Avacidaminococcus intestinavium]